MKKLISLLLVLSLMLGVAATLAEGEENPNFNIDSKSTWLSGFFNADGKVFGFAPYAVYEVNIEEKKIVEHKKILQSPESGYIEKCVALEGKLHVICDGTKLYELAETDEGLIPKKLVGKLQKKSGYEFDGENDMLAVGKKLYYSMVNYSDSMRGSIFEYDMESGQTTEVLKDIYGSISKYKDDKILICYVDSEKGDQKNYSGTAVIYSYDTNSKKLEEIHSFTVQDRYSASQVFYNPVLDGIFYIESGKVFKVIDKKEAEYVAKVPFGSTNPLVLPDGRALFQNSHLSQLCIRKLDPKFVPQKELVVLNAQYNDAFGKVEGKMTDVALVYKELGWGRAEDLAQGIISSKDSWDIMVVGTNIDVESLIKKGYIEPINSEKLKASMDRTWEAYTEGASFDGKLYALPTEPHSQSFYYDKAAFEKLKLEKPKTLGDLLDLKYKFAKNQIEGADGYKLFENGNDFTAIDDIVSMYVNQMLYENKDLSFDTPEFRELMEKFFRNKKEIKEENQSEEEYMEDTRKSLLSNDDALNLEQYSYRGRENGSENEKRKLDFLPISAVAGLNPVITIEGQKIVINSQSKNKELAIETLEKIVENYSDKIKAQLYKDWSEPVLSEHFESFKKSVDEARERVLKMIEDAKTDAEKRQIEKDNAWMLEDYEKSLEREKYLISKENLEEYQKLMKENKFRMLRTADKVYFGPNVLTEGLYNQIESGKMTTDQFIKEIENKIKLIKLERR